VLTAKDDGDGIIFENSLELHEPLDDMMVVVSHCPVKHWFQKWPV
jgi:hypothetical protein